MANSILKVDVDVMDNKVNDLKNISKTMDVLQENIRNVVSNVASAWQSNAGTNFKEKYTRVDHEVGDAIEDLLHHIDSLQRTADVYRTTESNVTQNVDALATDDIF